MGDIQSADRDDRRANAWGRLPNGVLRSSRFSLVAKVIAAYRCTFTENWKTVPAHMAKAFTPPLGKTRTRKAIAGLRAAGFFGEGQAEWANRSPEQKGNPSRFRVIAEKLENPQYDYTIIRRSWFDGTLSVEEVGALICIAARVGGPSVFLNDIAKFLGRSETTAGARVAKLCDRGLVTFSARTSDGRFRERDYKLVSASAERLASRGAVIDEGLPVELAEDCDGRYLPKCIDLPKQDACPQSLSERLALAEANVGDLVQWTKASDEQLAVPARVVKVYEDDEGRWLDIQGIDKPILSNEVIVYKHSLSADDDDEAALWDPSLLGWIEHSSELRNVDEEIVAEMLRYDQQWFRKALLHAAQGRIGGRLLGRAGLKAFFWLAAFIHERSEEDEFAFACCSLLNAVYDRIGSRPGQRLNSWGLIGERLLKHTYGDDFIDPGARIFGADHAPMFVVSDDGDFIRYRT